MPDVNLSEKLTVTIDHYLVVTKVTDRLYVSKQHKNLTITELIARSQMIQKFMKSMKLNSQTCLELQKS